MNNMADGERELKKAHFRELLKDLEFLEKTREAQATVVGVDVVTLWRWRKEITPAEWEKIRDEGRRNYASHALEVDLALLRKCKKGEVPAIETFYEKYEGWSPKQISEHINKSGENVSTEEVLQALLKSAKPEDLKKALAEKEKPVEAPNLGVVGGD